MTVLSARELWQSLLPEEGRAGGAARITVGVLVVALVMLAFRMPFLSIGPYLVFLVSQRDMPMTRAAAALGVAVAVLSSALLYLAAWGVWDEGWLRVFFWGCVFYAGYFCMVASKEPRVFLGPLVIVALFTFLFDEVPDPNRVLGGIGWLWAILGLVVTVTFALQWLMGHPGGKEFLRGRLRAVLTREEKGWRDLFFRGGATFGGEDEEGLRRVEILEKSGVLTEKNAAVCGAVFSACGEEDFLEAKSEGDREAALRVARKVREFRVFEVLGRGRTEGEEGGLRLEGVSPEVVARASKVVSSFGGEGERGKKEEGFFAGDFWRNPFYPAFAFCATSATLGCYLFMTMVDWTGIHTCMITCAVTAIADAKARKRKQILRLAGALLGGVLGIGAVVFLIPVFDSLAAYLVFLGAGTFLAAWVSLGSEKISYAGWQIALAFYMTVMQDPHPSTKIEVIWDRWVGIFLGILAMGFALKFCGGFFSEREGEGGEGRPEERRVEG